ncbi:hypothetical protein [Pseudomonas brassicacearum]|uniref:Uncharacterized protein n=1 Tax=Pseudomonas brassicacearum TaxID=930166 RepID=A0A423GN92_9PSED|nr:hypothetical protein [Pseudomonas brassicacearum]ROM93791.1 hypothetical protein BK658_19190 [Pseudomonas brassicacearum]
MPMTQDQAARIITSAIRRYIAEKSYARMIKKGAIWNKDDPRSSDWQAELSMKKKLAAIRSISQKNIHNLISNLEMLTPPELTLVTNIKHAKFFATHTTNTPRTNKGGGISLYSRQKLLDRGVIFNTKNSPVEDIALLGNDDFVFFSLEVGETPKKGGSAFGDLTYRFNLHETIFMEVGWLSLVEMRFARTPDLSRHIHDLSAEDYTLLKKRELSPLSTVFFGQDMINGIALSLILDLRKLSPTGQTRLLAMAGESSLNSLINGIYRPELKVPRHYFSSAANAEPHKIVIQPRSKL